MRRIPRLDRSIDLLRACATAQTPSPYLCSACKHRASAFSTTALRQAKTPWTEKVRKRIWGLETPPGQDDPYSENRTYDRTRGRALEEDRGLQRTGVEPDMSTYEPASTWDGLERVGGFGGWWKENWDSENQFKGFFPKEVITDNEEVTVALHRAVVEAFALREAGRPLEDISKVTPGEDPTWEVQISSSETGPTLQFSNSASRDDIVESLLVPAIDDNETAEVAEPTVSEEQAAATAADPSAEDIPQESDYESLIASWGKSWLQAPLEGPEIKFAVIKRTMQLTGLRIPDSAIKSVSTVQGLLSHLVKPPKPRKLAEALQQKEELLKLPNVAVYERRITPIDKEKSVGRWKLIEQELINRDLPVTGH